MQALSTRFAGKAFLSTGALSVIGEVWAKALASDGTHVAWFRGGRTGLERFGVQFDSDKFLARTLNVLCLNSEF